MELTPVDWFSSFAPVQDDAMNVCLGNILGMSMFGEHTWHLKYSWAQPKE
jgi:hypothetical protein